MVSCQLTREVRTLLVALLLLVLVQPSIVSLARAETTLKSLEADLEEISWELSAKRYSYRDQSSEFTSKIIKTASEYLQKCNMVTCRSSHWWLSAHRFMAMAAAENGHDRQAVHHYRRAYYALLSRNKHETLAGARLLYSMGFHLHHIGKRKLATDLIERSAALYRSKATGMAFFQEKLQVDAQLLIFQRRFSHAEESLKANVTMQMATNGIAHTNAIIASNFLGEFYLRSGKFKRAFETFQTTIQRIELLKPQSKFDLAITYANSGLALRSMNQCEAAVTRFEKSLSLLKASKPNIEHASNAQIKLDLAKCYYKLGRWKDVAQVMWPIVTNTHFSDRVELNDWRQVQRNLSEGRQLLANALWRLHAETTKSKKSPYLSKLFKISQIIGLTDAALAQGLASERWMLASTEQKTIVRQLQRLAQEIYDIDQQLLNKLIGKKENFLIAQKDLLQKSEKLANHRSFLERQLYMLGKNADRQPGFEFPIASILEVQERISKNEAVVFLSIIRDSDTEVEDRLAVWIITKDLVRVNIAPPPLKIIDQYVTTLRCGLDISMWIANQHNLCKKLLSGYIKETPHDVSDLPFNLEVAWKLYQTIFSFSEDQIFRKNLIVVKGNTSLASIPFNILIQRKPKSDFGDYLNANWLIKQHSIRNIVSVGMFNRKTHMKPRSFREHRYLGVGNPLLRGPQDDPATKNSAVESYSDALQRQNCPKDTWWSRLTGSTRNVLQHESTRRTGVSLFVLKNSNAVSKQIDNQWSLPETADEICAVAKIMGTKQKDILLGSRASEANLVNLNLSKYSILHFATHGVLAGQLSTLSEPGLILTPPASPDTVGDGYLSASEILSLELDADLVVLSACNTAGAGKGKAEALSGLASAFLEAGTRSMFVSHWEVPSKSTVDLIVTVFSAMRLKRESLHLSFQGSMLGLMKQDGDRLSHPAYWGGFSLIDGFTSGSL